MCSVFRTVHGTQSKCYEVLARMTMVMMMSLRMEPMTSWALPPTPIMNFLWGISLRTPAQKKLWFSWVPICLCLNGHCNACFHLCLGVLKWAVWGKIHHSSLAFVEGFWGGFRVLTAPDPNPWSHPCFLSFFHAPKQITAFLSSKCVLVLTTLHPSTTIRVSSGLMHRCLVGSLLSPWPLKSASLVIISMTFKNISQFTSLFCFQSSNYLEKKKSKSL